MAKQCCRCSCWVFSLTLDGGLAQKWSAYSVGIQTRPGTHGNNSRDTLLSLTSRISAKSSARRYPHCPDVWNVDMTNQITVWPIACIFPHATCKFQLPCALKIQTWKILLKSIGQWWTASLFLSILLCERSGTQDYYV